MILFTFADLILAKIFRLLGFKKRSKILKENDPYYWKNYEGRWRFGFQFFTPINMAIFFILKCYGEKTENYEPMLYSAVYFCGSCWFWFISIRILMKFEQLEEGGNDPKMKTIHILAIFGVPILVVFLLFFFAW